MSIRSGAEPGAPASPDESLTASWSHRGLTYPFGRRGPEPGETFTIADGVAWTRSPLPGSLRHINLWLIGKGEGFGLVDTGLNSPEARAAWDRLQSGPLAARRLEQIVVTHFHPDHIGLAGWLAERHAVGLSMTRSEWLFARMLFHDRREAPPEEAVRSWRQAGWNEDQVAAAVSRGWGQFASAVSPVPVSYRRLQDGDPVTLGGMEWRVFVGSGHSPEHACLVEASGRYLLAGDQVLPRITSNVSLSTSEPEGDPLADWLDSLERLRVLPADILVLPAHGEPFVGLHERVEALSSGHFDRLDALEDLLAEPRRVVDCFPVLFARKIDAGVLGLATGEALAHLRYLETHGRARREMRDGVAWYERA